VTALSEPREPSQPDGHGPVRRGTVYSSRHAIRSLTRSETETTAISAQFDDDKIANPKPTPTPNDMMMDTKTAQPAAQDQVKVPAPAEAGSIQEPKRRVRRAGRALLPVIAATLAAFIVATGYLAIRERRQTSDAGRWGAAATAPVQAGGDSAAAGLPNPFGTPPPPLTGVPTRLKVNTIGVDTALETLRLNKNGSLDPPKDFAKAGWYAAGTVPGDLGPAVIAGHVDNRQGPAVFYRLRELEAGDKIDVVRGGTTVRFTVTSTAWYPKKAFPTAEVYGPTPDSQLRLITCGGVFDHRLRSYKDNLVIYAVTG
jgi:hypothetical protein